jgi:hypothetical protein
MNNFKQPQGGQFLHYKPNLTMQMKILDSCKEGVPMHHHTVLHEGEMKIFRSNARNCPICKAVFNIKPKPSLWKRFKNKLKRIIPWLKK